MQFKKKLKNFMTDIRFLLKLKPLIFATMIFGLIYGAVTMIVGSVKLSYFIGVTGACALVLGSAKFYALKKFAEAQILEPLSAVKTETAAAKNIAVLASVISFLHFSIAVVCTFFAEENPSNYGIWFIFFVAGAAFIKIILSTVNAIKSRKNQNIIIHHVNLIDNANALIAMGLTQRAILYFVQGSSARLISGIGGMFFSICALFVCLTMFLKYKRAIERS